MPTASPQEGEAPVPTSATVKPTAVDTPHVDDPGFAPLSFSAPDCNYGGEFSKIESVDSRTVRFVLCYPDVAFLAKIAFPPFSIYSAHWLEQSAIDFELRLNYPVGSGPYQLADWIPGEMIRFSAFDGYWNSSEPATKGLVFKWNQDEAQRLLELQAGTVQGIDSPNFEDDTSEDLGDSLTRIERAPLSVVFLGMNNTYPPFDNQLVRQAITLALDRRSIVDTMFPPGFVTPDFFTPCSIPFGCGGDPWYSADPEQARQLLAQAGFPDGFSTQLSYRAVTRSYMDNPERIVQEIQSQLHKNLNMEVKLISIDSDKFLNAAEEGLLPGLFLLGWGADYPDVSNFLDTHFGDQAGKLLGNPFPDVLAPLRLGNSTSDAEQRVAYYTEANNAIRTHVPLIPISHGGWAEAKHMTVAFNRTVSEAYADPFGFEHFSAMHSPGFEELTWMQSYEPQSLYCADEVDVDTLRACAQIAETLYRFPQGSLQPEPAVAEICEPDGEMKVWTCRLREDVSFHDGSLMNANDVVLSFAVQWDEDHPLRQGRLGDFSYFTSFWGAFLNTESP